MEGQPALHTEDCKTVKSSLKTHSVANKALCSHVLAKLSEFVNVNNVFYETVDVDETQSEGNVIICLWEAKHSI